MIEHKASRIGNAGLSPERGLPEKPGDPKSGLLSAEETSKADVLNLMDPCLKEKTDEEYPGGLEGGQRRGEECREGEGSGGGKGKKGGKDVGQMMKETAGVSCAWCVYRVMSSCLYLLAVPLSGPSVYPRSHFSALRSHRLTLCLLTGP